jgi:serine/threonine protein phosphatase PrpC
MSMTEGSTPWHPSQHNQSQPGSQPSPTALAKDLPLAVWGESDRGRQREGNEDSVYPHSESDTFSFQPNSHHLAQKGQLLIVADGVGGAAAGSEASHWATRVAVERYYDLTNPDPGANLRTAVEVANASLYQYLQSTNTPQAGCTMAAAVIHRSILYVANVGDSRVYLLRNGQIAQLTRDHTLTQRKIDEGLIRPEQADTDPGSHVLTRSMGAEPAVQVDLFPPLQLALGDTVLLCSDGLTDMLEDAEIARLAGDRAPRRTAQRLIAAANRQGGLDNISVVIAQVGVKRAAAGGGLLKGTRNMSRQQRTVLLLGTLLVATAFLVMAWITFRPVRDAETPTCAPSPTVEVSTTATTMPVAVPDTPQPTDTAAPREPTSTPAPTSTPTATLTPTHTPTPTPTLTSTPEPPPPKSGGGSSGGSKPEPTNPPPTNPPPSD